MNISRHKFMTIAGMALAALVVTPAAIAVGGKAYLEITLKVAAKDRPSAAAVYTKYKLPFLKTIAGAQSKMLLLRDEDGEDVQVLHGFDLGGHPKTGHTWSLQNRP